ncbi:DUF4263 domain-containing protein [Microvenator marinus]|uniref:DUF4263 domain-containing protein n=1 Tax=Microvenator marinus TaxID=2600177 RepID=A0A5B8XWX9_9DELT|nr:Shedu anti-phage system protein SduA domain-containing protein [Microvenator marinus]QED29944.1 DUF4263 domain-containing protein [Microvenator marinus]
MTSDEFKELVEWVVNGLNNEVFATISDALKSTPSIRGHLNPAFPYPRKLRIAVLGSHLVVEYVGPEDPRTETVDIEAVIRPDWTVLDFLGIDISHLSSFHFPMTTAVKNSQVFLGDAINLLGDYMYDVVSNPNDLILNAFPDFTTQAEPTYVSNTTFLWSDSKGALRIRRIDFLEVFPIQEGEWSFHSEEGFRHLAQFLLNHRVPAYEVALHKQLNEFIELVGQKDVPEPKITGFLAKHPEFLQLAFGAHAVYPETLLEWQYATGKQNLKPDFLIVKMDGYADIFEFKLPRLKGSAMVGKKTRSRPSAEVDSALAQIDEYEEWSSQEVNRQWLEKTKGIKIYTPHTYLVMGHRDDFTSEDRQRLRKRRNATIFTYDEFIEMTRMQLYRVR